MKGIDCIILSLSGVGIFFCMFLSSLFINQTSTFMLAVFNLFFIMLTFPLDGKLVNKTSLLLVGNVIGVFWNYFFYQFTLHGTYHFGVFFNAFCAFLNPFANLLWIVSFWSISLTLLTNAEGKEN